MAQVTARALGRSSLYGLVAQFWRIGSRLFLTPLIIAKIGLEGYGVWTLLFSLCAYATVVDKTFSTAYSKFTAEYDAKQDYAGLSRIISSGVMLTSGISATALFLLWAFHGPILHALNVPEALLSDAGTALLIVCVAVSLRTSAGCVFQVLAGMQRLDLQHKLLIVASALEFAVAITLLLFGWGLVGLALGHLVGQTFAISLAWLLCRRVCPQFRISVSAVGAWGLRRIVSLGGRFQLLSVLQLILDQGVKVLISGLLGVSILAIHELALKLLSLGLAASGAFIGPLMPAFANLHSRGDRQSYETFYQRASKLVAGVSLPCFAFIAIFADKLLLVWTGGEYPLAAWATRCLSVAFALHMLTGVATASLRGQGTVRLETGYAVVIGLVLAALIGPGYLLAGYHGIVAAIVVGMLAGSSWFLRTYARNQGLDLKHYLRETLLRSVTALGPAIVGVGLVASFTRLSVFAAGARWNALAEVFIWGVLFTTAVGILGWYFMLAPSERTWLLRSLVKSRDVDESAAAKVVQPPHG